MLNAAIIGAQARLLLSSAPPVATTWWRVRFPTVRSGNAAMTGSDPYVDIQYITMSEDSGGANLVPDNVSMKASVGTLANAVADSDSLWNNAGIGPLAMGMWGAFEFAQGVIINEVKIRNHINSIYVPAVVIVESSTDGVNWDFEWGQGFLSWGSEETKTFNRPGIDWSAASYRDWAFVTYQTTGTANLGIFEMEMASSLGGSDLCSGGTPRSTDNLTYPASSLTDNDTATLCGSNVIARLAHVGYSFADAQKIDEVRFLRTVDGEQPIAGALCVGAGTPGSFAGPWYIKQECWGFPNAAGATVTHAWDFRNPRVPVGAEGTHRYWRVRAASKGTLGNGYTYSCAKLDFLSAGVSLVGGGAALSSSENSGSTLDDYAFDGNTATIWASSATLQTFQWLGYDFITPVRPEEIVLQAENDVSLWNRTFSAFVVEWSDDGKMWHKEKTFEVTTIAGALGEQSFSLTGVAPPEITYPYAIPLINAGFETGSISPWAQLLSSTPVIITDPVATGTYSASSGPASSSLAAQTITLPAGLHTDIDAGFLEASVSAKFAGFAGAGGNDAGGLIFEFLDASNTRLGISFDAGSRLPSTTYAEKTLTALVPVGTRKIRVGWRGMRMVSGTNCDVYVDDFSNLIITKRLVSHEQVFITYAPDVVGWTNVTGTLIKVGGVYGMGSLCWNAAAGESYMTINLPSGRNTAIDAGTADLILDCIFAGFSDDTDSSRTYVEFYDGSNVIVGSRIYNEPATVDWGAWAEGRRYTVDIPANARSFRFGFMGTRVTGTELSSYFVAARGIIES